MQDYKKIVKCISQDGKSAYHRARKGSGAYVIRGNSIVKTDAKGNIMVVKGLSQVKVRLKDDDRVIVLSE